MTHPDSAQQVASMDWTDHLESGTGKDDTSQPGVVAKTAELRNAPSFSIEVDTRAGAFVAAEDGVEFGAVTFAEKNGKVTLLATSILPDYRGRGLTTELVRRVLDSIVAEGKQATVRCPVFRSFVARNPEFASGVNVPDAATDGAGDV